MRTSDTINELATALAKAQAKMQNAKFDAVNPAYKSKYATWAAVRDAVTPALTENGLALVHATGDDNGRLVVYTRMIHSSGQWIESAYPIIADTNKPQIMGSAYSYAKRYSTSALCNIASEQDDDAQSAQDAGKQNGNGFPAGNPDVKYTKYPANVKSTPGVVRARENNAFFTKLETEIMDLRTKNDALDWRAMRDPDLRERVGLAGNLELSAQYEEKLASLP